VSGEGDGPEALECDRAAAPVTGAVLGGIDAPNGVLDLADHLERSVSGPFGKLAFEDAVAVGLSGEIVDRALELEHLSVLSLQLLGEHVAQRCDVAGREVVGAC
jgi:hypothetical protein